MHKMSCHIQGDLMYKHFFIFELYSIKQKKSRSKRD